MRAFARIVSVAIVCGLACTGTIASAQPAIPGCVAEQPAKAPQTLRCGGLTIVAEDGAQFTIAARDRSGDVAKVDLRGKALLLDVPKQKIGHRFEVITPQAIAAVRGTKWVIDAQGTTTSVLVLGGKVAVRRRIGSPRVILGPGDGVDVDQDIGVLKVKRWPQARISALLARLGQ